MDNMPDLIFVKDRDGQFLTVNAALLEALKANSLADVLGKDERDFSASEFAERLVADDRRVMASGKPLLDREERTYDSAGGEKWFLTTKIPLHDAGGNVTGLVGIGRNITQRKRAEQLMQRQALEARLLYQATTLAGQTSSFTEALQKCTDLVCELTDWPIGHVYLPDEKRKTLVPTPIWHKADDERFAEFQAATEQTRYQRGNGLPGRIWERKKAQWIRSIRDDAGFSLRDAVRGSRHPRRVWLSNYDRGRSGRRA